MVNVCSSYESGRNGERESVEYLRKKGYAIIERNYRAKGGEIDIIARVGDTLVFVEVKSRSSSRFGYPEEAVGMAKRRRIARVMRAYLYAHTISPETYIRFDIISLQLSAGASGDVFTHLQNCDIGEDVF
ncbi:MAG: YraN family protein [Candidatus Uhrbacteria bacterium]|nr:YraN family protein [Candidatus Uhrbacteria bacterium]